MEKNHIISVLVENEFGVLARIAGLFSSKGYNIDSLTVAETTDPTVSRMTIVTHGSDQIVSQILKQLDKLVNVLKVEDLQEKHLAREVLLVKVKGDFKKAVAGLEAKILQESGVTTILEITGEVGDLAKNIDRLKKVCEIVEIVRSGVIAIARGEHAL